MRGRAMKIEQRDIENNDNNIERVIDPSKRYGIVTFSFFFIFFCSLILLVQPSSSSTPQQPSNFTVIDLIGDAHLVSDTHVRLTRPAPSSSGLLRRRDPLTFSATATFSTEFEFSVVGTGDGLILVLTPATVSAASFAGNGSDYVGVEFDTSKDDNVGDMNANHVGIDVGSHVSVAVANVSDLNLVLKNGEKLKAWVDYKSDSTTLEVRLTKSGEEKPNVPIVSYKIDLFKMWGGNPVFAGLGSSNGAKYAQVVSVYSWRVNMKDGSKGLNSLRAGAQGLDEKQHGKLCPLTVLAGIIFGTGCVALVTFVVLFMWVIFFTVCEEESLVKIPEHHPSDVRYERIDVAVDKNSHGDELRG